MHASQTRKINLNAFTLVALIFTLLSLAISIFDNAEIKDVLGATLTAIFLILLPGYLLTEYIFKFNAPIKSLLVGSSLILSVIIPIHAALSKISSSFMLVILILLIDFILIIKMTKSKLFTYSFNFKIDSKKIILILLTIFVTILLFRQSLHVPSNNLDHFLIWPDTYNAIAQAAEITKNGPSIFPFVADALVPLKYHWGAFSLGSFISLFGNFELIVVIYKVQFILLGFLFFGLLYFTGKEVGKSWIAGLFSLILGGLTIYPNFPEFNEQIGIARPFISSNSMPQFTANLFAILGIYLLYCVRKNVNLKLFFILIFFTTLTATLSKGPVGLLILILSFLIVILEKKIYLKNNLIYVILPGLFGFLLGYSQITSNTSQPEKSGTSLWLNPLDTVNLLAESYGIELNIKSLLIFITLFLLSFIYLLFSFIYSIYIKNIRVDFPLLITSFAGVFGSLLLEAWGNSQLFLLYSVIPFIAILLSTQIFQNQDKIELNSIYLIFLGFAIQPLSFNLLSSFVTRSSVLKTFLFWIISVITILLISILISKIISKNVLYSLLITSTSIGLFSGLTKFDPIAYSLPEHPYSITVGTYEIGKYLRKNSDNDDLLATNRHCAGLQETKTCTARQFALSALAERRVFIEGWSYTTCPLDDPISNSYWKEDSWKINQEFFVNPNADNWNLFKKSQVKWLVVDTSRPSSTSYSEFADLVKESGQMQLWKIKNPEINLIKNDISPCSSQSIFQNK